MNKVVVILAMAVALLGTVTADGKDFIISIVGQEQSNPWQYKREGLLLVYGPSSAQSPSGHMDWMEDKPTGTSFYVVIQNVQPAADTMAMGASAWYDCLQFTISDGSGRTYHTSRREFNWTRNPLRTWIFPSGGMRVMPVDFINGGWQGLPPAPSQPELVTMTATFNYPDSSGKLVSVSSSPTEVYLCSKSAVAAVPAVKLKLVRVDSEETNAEDGSGANAVDGDPSTYWHTQWQGKNPGPPHEIVIELVPPAVIDGFAYLPRQDYSDHGTIKDYEFSVSNDGRSFSLVSQGTFGPGKGEKVETFAPTKCRFIKLKALSEINGLPWTSAAEIRVIQVGEDASARDYWRGDIVPAAPQDIIYAAHPPYHLPY